MSNTYMTNLLITTEDRKAVAAFAGGSRVVEACLN